MKWLLIFLVAVMGIIQAEETPFPLKLSLAIASAPSVQKEFDRLPVVETEYLLLRPLQEGDEHYLEPFAEKIELTSLGTLSLNQWQHRAAANEAVPWVVIHKEDEKIIGVCGFYTCDERNASASLMVILDADYQEMRFVAQAVTNVMAYGFQIGINRIDLYLYPDQVGHTMLTQCIAPSIGLKKIGKIPDYFYMRGCYHAFELYCALKKDVVREDK